MSVWLTIPSKRTPEECAPTLAKWREMGYKVILWRDDLSDSDFKERGAADELVEGKYPGYAFAVNRLITHVMDHDKSAEWMIAAGDDILPDPTKDAEEIARECGDHFRNLHIEATGETFNVHPTFGVMQPTGDDWSDSQGRIIERIAGSAWYGREYCKRVNKGQGGPLWPAFTHMFVDEAARALAVKLGVYWERPDLVHYHAHWGRPQRGERMAPVTRMPEFLKEANSGKHWNESRAEFERLKASDFAECMPL